MNNNIVLKCTNIGKSYRDGSLNVQVLRNLNLEVKVLATTTAIIPET